MLLNKGGCILGRGHRAGFDFSATHRGDVMVSWSPVKKEGGRERGERKEGGGGGGGGREGGREGVRLSDRRCGTCAAEPTCAFSFFL